MKRIKIKCVVCGRPLFFSISKDNQEGGPEIEIKCSKDRCGAINIVDYHNPDKITVRLKE